MKPRHCLRLVWKVRANAALCGVPLTEWIAMSRTERKRRLTEAKGAAKQHPFFQRCKHGVQFLNQCDNCPGGSPAIDEETDHA